MKERVVVGMSGGVDSAVSAWLLKQQGYEVIGMFMKNWEDDDDGEYCSSRQDWLDAVSCADLIGVDIEAVNFSATYRDRVFAGFLREYEAGRTPNPDVLCNTEIKFKAFLDHAFHELGAQHIATGHYARLRHHAQGGVSLLRGIDSSKDQSYFLHQLTQAQLQRAMFPVGALPKSEVRRLAHELNLPVAAKRDSTGICFIGERPFREFLQHYLPTQPGDIVDEAGTVVGRHEGLSFYTIGQRKGLGIGGRKHAEAEAWYVIGKALDTNRLLVAQGHGHARLWSRWLRASPFHWIEAPDWSAPFSAKTRYRQQDGACEVREEGGQVMLSFASPQWAVTPGQYAVLYQGETCLGGGVITACEQCPS